MTKPLGKPLCKPLGKPRAKPSAKPPALTKNSVAKKHGFDSYKHLADCAGDCFKQRAPKDPAALDLLLPREAVEITNDSEVEIDFGEDYETTLAGAIKQFDEKDRYDPDFYSFCEDALLCGEIGYWHKRDFCYKGVA